MTLTKNAALSVSRTQRRYSGWSLLGRFFADGDGNETLPFGWAAKNGVLFGLTVANPEHLAKVKEGVEAFDQWRIQTDAKPDLSCANLSGVKLSLANLTEANLRGADLTEANLSGAKLRGADLNGASLRAAILLGTDLERS